MNGGVSAVTPLGVRVFVSYRRMDNDHRAQVPGRVTDFTARLRGAIQRRVLASDDSDVFMDIDPDKIIGSEAWRDKITRHLEWANVFISIMTANYLASTPDGTGCQWELGVFRDLSLSGDERPRTIITLRLCQDWASASRLESEPWSFLSSQEIIDYDRCDRAWNQGPGQPAWEDLISYVADAVIEFGRKEPAQTGGISLDSSEPTVGAPITWHVDCPLAAPTTSRTEWLADGAVVAADVDTYVPTPADVGKELCAQVTFSRSGGHTVIRRSLPATVVEGKVRINVVSLVGTGLVGNTLSAWVDGLSPPDASLTYCWGRFRSNWDRFAWVHGVTLEGQSGATYVLTSADAGHEVAVRVLAHREGCESAAAISNGCQVFATTTEMNARDKQITADRRVRERSAKLAKDYVPSLPSPPGAVAWAVAGVVLLFATMYLWLYSMSRVGSNLWWLIGCVLSGVSMLLSAFVIDIFYDEMFITARRERLAKRAIGLATLAGLASGILAVVFGGIPIGASWHDLSGFLPWTRSAAQPGVLAAYGLFVTSYVLVSFSLLAVLVRPRRA